MNDTQIEIAKVSAFCLFTGFTTGAITYDYNVQLWVGLTVIGTVLVLFEPLITQTLRTNDTQ